MRWSRRLSRTPIHPLRTLSADEPSLAAKGVRASPRSYLPLSSELFYFCLKRVLNKN